MRTLIFAFILLISGTSALAAGHTTAEQVRQASIRFLGQFAAEQAALNYKVDFEPGTIDKRLALAQCSRPLDVEFTSDPFRTTRPSLLVSCQGEQPWRMYVTAKVSIHGPALVAARPLARGERISAGMISTEAVKVNASRRGIIRTPAEVIGMEVRRPVQTGTVITPDILAAPDAVERGDHVIITAQSGAFSVSSRGKALANGSIGEQVLVENLRSSRTIKARVVAPGHVEIPMQ